MAQPTDEGESAETRAAFEADSQLPAAPSLESSGRQSPDPAAALHGRDRQDSFSQYVYALGKIEPRFPHLALEKEFAQAVGRGKTDGLTDRQAAHKVLSDRQNRYLARQLCWLFTIEGLETYVLQPRDPADFELLIEALRPNPRAVDLDVVIGQRGPVASPELCGGLSVPLVVFDQIYSFDIDSLISALPVPKGMDPKIFGSAAEELFARVLDLADNTGATANHRAVNYLAVRYPAIYAKTAEQHTLNASLSGVEVLPSSLSGIRKVLDVVFSFTHRQTDVKDKYFVRVDVTEEFPFLVTKLAPYYDR